MSVLFIPPILLLLFALEICVASNVPPPVSLRSGRKVPAHILETEFGPNHRENAESSLFELSTKNEAVGKNEIIDLSVASTVTVLSSPKVTQNGKIVSVQPGRIRSGGGLYITESSSGEIVGVWSESLHLVPLNAKSLPGVFINKMAVSPRAKKESDGSKNTSLPLQFIPWDEACSSRLIWRDYEIAVATDNTLCARHGNNVDHTVAATMGSIQVADRVYQAQSCIRLNVRSFEVHCSDPKDPYKKLAGKSNEAILGGVKNYWGWNRWYIRRDVVLFLPGFGTTRRWVGMAFIKSACDHEDGFAWAKDINPRYIAHELGHTLGAYHKSYGIMKAAMSTHDPMKFDSANVKEISDFVDKSIQATCLRNKATPLTCASGLSRMASLRCAASNIGGVTPAWESGLHRDSKVRVWLKQESGKLTVSLYGHRAYMTRVGVKVAPHQWVEAKEIKISKVFWPPTKKASWTVEMDDIERYLWQVSCCGQREWVSIVVRFCDSAKAERCTLEFKRLWTKIKCFSCPRRKTTYFPMGPMFKCPICK